MADMELSEEVMSFFENLDNDEPAVQETEQTETVEIEPVNEEVQTEETEEALEVDPNEITAEEEVTNDENVEETAEETDTWEDRYRNLQSQKDREIAAVSEQLNTLQQWAQQQYAWQQQLVSEQQAQAQQQAQASQRVEITRDQVDSSLDLDPVGTFRYIAQSRPDLMPNLISMVRGKEQLGHEVADQMSAEWTNYQIAQQQEMFQRQLQEQQYRTEAPQQVSATMQQILGTLEQRHGETFVALRDEISEKAAETAPHFKQYMEQNGMEVTPQAIADFISQVYLDVREQKMNEAAQKPQRPKKLAPEQHVESSSANRHREATPDEDAMNELLQGARALGIDVTQQTSA